MAGKKRLGQRIGDVEEVANLKKRPRAADHYSHLRIQLPDGSEQHLLLTDYEMRQAVERAAKNSEDLPPVSWIRDFFD